MNKIFTIQQSTLDKSISSDSKLVKRFETLKIKLFDILEMMTSKQVLGITKENQTFHISIKSFKISLNTSNQITTHNKKSNTIFKGDIVDLNIISTQKLIKELSKHYTDFEVNKWKENGSI